MTWFEELTGCAEHSSDYVREQLFVDGDRLHSRSNGESWLFGNMETPSLDELRKRARIYAQRGTPNSVREIIANVQELHRDEANEHSLFQVASQFNLLEMMAPDVTPEWGVGIYERDPTQGPACAIAAGAGTIFRNYFAEVNGRLGQSKDNQIDCLADVGAALGNLDQKLWRMVNGYALPAAGGLQEINAKLYAMDESERDQVRKRLRIGLQWDTQVTLDGASHTVTQAYCSALPIAYTDDDLDLWKPFAKLVLEATYEATICAAVENANRTGNNQLFLTLVGGGAFGNEIDWILDAIRRSLARFPSAGLDIAIVSYSRSKPSVQDLIQEFPKTPDDGGSC